MNGDDNMDTEKLQQLLEEKKRNELKKELIQLDEFDIVLPLKNYKF